MRSLKMLALALLCAASAVPAIGGPFEDAAAAYRAALGAAFLARQTLPMLPSGFTTLKCDAGTNKETVRHELANLRWETAGAVLKPSPQTVRAVALKLGVDEAQALKVCIPGSASASSSDKTPPVDPRVAASISLIETKQMTAAVVHSGAASTSAERIVRGFSSGSGGEELETLPPPRPRAPSPCFDARDCNNGTSPTPPAGGSAGLMDARDFRPKVNFHLDRGGVPSLSGSAVDSSASEGFQERLADLWTHLVSPSPVRVVSIKHLENLADTNGSSTSPSSSGSPARLRPELSAVDTKRGPGSAPLPPVLSPPATTSTAVQIVELKQVASPLLKVLPSFVREKGSATDDVEDEAIAILTKEGYRGTVLATASSKGIQGVRTPDLNITAGPYRGLLDIYTRDVDFTDIDTSKKKEIKRIAGRIASKKTQTPAVFLSNPLSAAVAGKIANAVWRGTKARKIKTLIFYVDGGTVVIRRPTKGQIKAMKAAKASAAAASAKADSDEDGDGDGDGKEGDEGAED